MTGTQKGKQVSMTPKTYGRPTRILTKSSWFWVLATSFSVALLTECIRALGNGLLSIRANYYLERKFYLNAIASLDQFALSRVILVFFLFLGLMIVLFLINRYVSPLGWISAKLPFRNRTVFTIIFLTIFFVIMTATVKVVHIEMGRNLAKSAGPNILLISMDTLRADALGAYDRTQTHTPNLDRFAAQGTLFETTVTTFNWTLPAHASMLTGLLPITHAVRSERDTLPKRFTTLPEALREAGYQTAAITAGGWLSPECGFEQGFDSFTMFNGGRDDLKQRFGEALSWLKEHEGSKWFLFLHSYQTHLPYYYHEGLSDPSTKPGMVEGASNIQTLPHKLWRLAYDGEVAYLDQEIGRFFDELHSTGLDRNTLIVFISDHGEAFGEHHYYEHGYTLFEEEVNVPFILNLPGGVRAGKRISEIVSLVDLFPTVLALAGVPPIRSNGYSLIRQIFLDDSGPVRPEYVFTESSSQASIRTKDDLFVFNLNMGQGETYNLHTVLADPASVASSAQPDIKWLKNALFDYLHRYTGPTDHLSPETAEHLRSLGYLM